MSTSTQYPSSAANWSGPQISGAIGWTNPTNAESSDSIYTTVTIGGSGGGPGALLAHDDDRKFGGGVGGSSSPSSSFLYLYNFQFPVPVGATINGISLSIYIHSTEPSTCTVSTIQLATSSSTSTGSNLSSSNTIPSSDTILTFGGSTNLWGATLSQSTVTSSGFGCLIGVNCSDTTTAQTVSLDYGQMTMYYSGGVVTAAATESLQFSFL